MRQIQNRSIGWVLLSLFLAVILLFFWQSNPSTTTSDTSPVVLKTDPVTSQEVLLRPKFSWSAGLGNVRSQDLLASLNHKLSPVLRDQISFLLSNPQLDHEIPVIVRVNPDLFARNAKLEGSKFSQGSNKALSFINSYMARLPAAEIKLLLESGAIEYITLDAPIRVVEPVTMDAPSSARFIDRVAFADGACESRSRSEEKPMQGHRRRREDAEISRNPPSARKVAAGRHRFLCRSSSTMHTDIVSSSFRELGAVALATNVTLSMKRH